MPIRLAADRPSLCFRRAAYERVSLVRAALDERLGLTPDEFQVEGDLLVVGPIHDEDALGALVAELEAAGLVYYDDFFELPGHWPAWLRLYAAGT